MYLYVHIEREGFILTSCWLVCIGSFVFDLHMWLSLRSLRISSVYSVAFQPAPLQPPPSEFRAALFLRMGLV